jgi:hypothetical protein
MATFIVRVMLTKEIQSNYRIIKDRLLQLGFSKEITSKNNNRFRLPNGNYLINTNNDIDTVFNTVRDVVYTIDKLAMILVTQSNGDKWINLAKV